MRINYFIFIFIVIYYYLLFFNKIELKNIIILLYQNIINMNFIYYALVCSLFNIVVSATSLNPNFKRLGYKVIILTKKKRQNL